MPPPTPTPSRPAVPAVAGAAWPRFRRGQLPVPAARCRFRRRRPGPRLALLPVMVSVALPCLECFLTPSLGLIMRVPVVALKMPPPWPIPPLPALPPLPPVASVAAVAAERRSRRSRRGRSAIAPVTAEATSGLVGGEVDGDAGEGRGSGVEEAASDPGWRRRRLLRPRRDRSARRRRWRRHRRCPRTRRARRRRFRRRRRRRRWPDYS